MSWGIGSSELHDWQLAVSLFAPNGLFFLSSYTSYEIHLSGPLTDVISSVCCLHTNSHYDFLIFYCYTSIHLYILLACFVLPDTAWTVTCNVTVDFWTTGLLLYCVRQRSRIMFEVHRGSSMEREWGRKAKTFFSRRTFDELVCKDVLARL